MTAIGGDFQFDISNQKHAQLFTRDKVLFHIKK